MNFLSPIRKGRGSAGLLDFLDYRAVTSLRSHFEKQMGKSNTELRSNSRTDRFDICRLESDSFV